MTTMLRISNFKRAAWVMSPLALLACSVDAPQSSVSQAQAPSVAVAQTKQLKNDGWIQAAQKHNNSGLTMRYRIDGEVALGQPVTISLEFGGARAADARVSISPAKALNVGLSSGMQKQGDGFQQLLKPGEISAPSITVTPMSEGAHMINIQLTQSGQTSATGIMLRVGQAGQTVETSGQSVTAENGEKLIVMPAK
jgi:hypothetical protein